MARTKKTTKTVMDKNIAYSLEIVKDGIAAEKKGKSFVDSKIDMYQLTDAFEYISRHKDLPFKVMAQRNKNVAEALKVIMYHGANALIRLEENLKKQPAKEAEEEYYDASIKLFEEESNLPSEIRKDFRSCFIDPTKAEKQIEALHFFMDKFHGRRAAFYIIAAIKRNWLMRPSFWALRDEFPNIGKESNINDYLAHPTCTEGQLNKAGELLEEQYLKIA